MSTKGGLAAMAVEAVTLLRDGDAGAADRRDAGIWLAYGVLSLSPVKWEGRSDFVCEVAYTLRRRYRWGMDAHDLTVAIHLLESALSSERRRLKRSSLLAALSITTMRWILAADGYTNAPSEKQLRLRAGQIAKAATLAERAAALAGDQHTRRTAVHAQAMVANGTPGQSAAAIRLLREARQMSLDDPEIRNDLARALCDGPTDGDHQDGLKELELMTLNWAESRPRDAFEATRFRSFAHVSAGDWRRASAALVQAVSLRTHARSVAGSRADEDRWVRDTFAIHSEAAFALVRSGDASTAVDVLDKGAALELQEALRPLPPDQLPSADEVVLYTSINRLGSLVILVSGDGIAPYELDLQRNDLSQHVLQYLQAYRDRTLDPDSPEKAKDWRICLEDTIDWLSEALVTPVLEKIPEACRLITIVLDSSIGLLPIHAAFLMSGSERAVRYAATSRSLSRSRRTEIGVNVLLVDEPTVPWAVPLPYASRECDVVASLVPESMRLSGSAATLDSVLSALTDHDIVHIAAHAISRPDNPPLSAVVLAGGEELSVALLGDLGEIGARLLVLSACESGVQDATIPEERMGLPLAFLRAGAAGVIASMWTVPDASTALLMARFYREWEQQRDPALALRAAQEWLRRSTGSQLSDWVTANVPELAGVLPDGDHENPYEHPRYWAAFALFGT